MRWTTDKLAKCVGAVLIAGVAALTARAADPPTPAPAPASTTTTKPTRATTATPAALSGLTFRATLAGRPDKAPYLGVTASPAQPALQKQLKLKPGVGLVVDAVDPDSPAAKAGVREYDVLHKFDEQLLINNEQFDVLVRNAEVGRDVRITVIREGKPQTLTAKLVEREVAPLHMTMSDYDVDPAGLNAFQPQANDYVALFNTPRATRVRGGTPLGAGSVSLRTPDGKQQINASSIVIESERHRMTVSNPDGRKHLKVEGKDGRMLFEGPVETPEELEQVPEELRQAYAEIFVDAPADEDVNAPAQSPSTDAEPARKDSPRPTK